MGKTYTLTEEQLDFISFMKEKTSSHPKLNSRLKTCLSGISGASNSVSEGSGIELFHSPHKMIEFLSLFSRDDRFKWYTHKWDMSTPFDIDDEINKQIKSKDVLNDMAYPKESGPAVNKKTYNQVWNFINFLNSGKKIYTWENTELKNVRFGWHSIVDLSKEKPDISVENLTLSDGHQFKDYVRMFKSVIEFRTDLNNDDRFSELVWSNIKKSGLPKDFEVEFSPEFEDAGYDLNVYCDVVGILCALDTICNWITKHKARSSEVKVDLISEKDYYILEILHVASYFNNIKKLQNPSGDFDELRKRLFSVCDFSLEGDYMEDGKMNGSLIVDALDKNTKMIDNSLTACNVNVLPDKIGGVKYKLKIYKQ